MAHDYSRALTNHVTWGPVVAGLVSAALFAGTLQRHVNSSQDPYATDVGEIQNALPRWGTLHFTGYPLYAATGSAVVTVLRAAGLRPAAAASAVSLLWGALAVATTAALAVALGAPGPAAAVGAMTLAVATSFWVDSSVAEVHSATMFFTAACLLAAVAYEGHGRPWQLLALALVFTQGVLHMRPVVLLAPALGILVWPRRREIMGHWRALVAVAVASPLVYLYMPLREAMGARWTFGQTRTWRGFWTMLLDTKAERIVQPATSLSVLAERGRMTLGLLGDDLPLAILATGLAGLALAAGSRRRAVALAAAWLPYAALTVVIWEGRVSDALLAVKLPVVMAAGVGWALIVGRLSRPPWPALAGGSAAIALALALTATAADNRGRVLAVTRDRSLEPVVDRVAGAVGAAKDPGRVTVIAPWGHVYWALAYAAEYRGVLAGARVVDHNADVGGLVHPGAVLVTPAETLYVFPPEWWSQRVEGMVLESYGPDMVRVGRRGEHHDSLPAPEPLADGPQPVNSAIDIVAARGAWFAPSRVHVVVHWRAKRRPAADYSVAVHLLAADPPTGSPVVLAQADAAAPVSGWWPTSRWRPGDVVRDDYLVAVPDGSRPRDVRITLYRRLPDGGFENGEWLTVPVPPEEDS